MTRRPLIIVVVLVFVLAIAVALVLKGRSGPTPHQAVAASEQARRKDPHPAPTLYCDFYNFMRNATVVSFYFSVDRLGRNDLKMAELFVVEPDGTKTEFGNVGDASLPQWSYKTDDGSPTITSPNEETEIILYGLKPKQGGVFWVEAGLRSNDYRNLEGKCRQSNF